MVIGTSYWERGKLPSLKSLTFPSPLSINGLSGQPSWVCPSCAGWPTIPVCPGLRGFPGVELSVTEQGETQANWDKLFTLNLEEKVKYCWKEPMWYFHSELDSSYKPKGWDLSVSLKATLDFTIYQLGILGIVLGAWPVGSAILLNVLKVSLASWLLSWLLESGENVTCTQWPSRFPLTRELGSVFADPHNSHKNWKRTLFVIVSPQVLIFLLTCLRLSLTFS